MKKIVLNIEGMTCSACSNGLEKFLSKQDGIISASVNLVMATALIEYDEKLTIKDLNMFVKEAGFKSLGEKKEKNNNANFIMLVFFSVLGIVLMYISMGHMVIIIVFPLSFVPSTIKIEPSLAPIYKISSYSFSILAFVDRKSTRLNSSHPK